MIDTHIHIVPGVDDGAKNFDLAIQMLELALREGIYEIIATPHFNLPEYRNLNVEKNFNLLREYIASEKINLKLHLGNEIYLSEENLESLKAGKINTLGDSRFLLIELPYYHFYPFHESMMTELKELGYNPILAHVERYQILRNHPEKLKALVENGIYAQITSKYIMEKKSRGHALNLIQSGLIHIVASDGHDILNRPPVMKEAYRIISKKFGESHAKTLFVNNPKMLLNNSPALLSLESQKKISLRNLLKLK